MDGTTQKYGSKQATGYSEYWKANNIYDLAGNCWEWTQEAYDTDSRASRGGVYYKDSSSCPASGRYDYNANNSDYSIRLSSHFNNKVGLNPENNKY